MKPFYRLILLIACFFLCFAATHDKPEKDATKGLFESEEVLKMTIRGDFKELLKDRDDECQYHKFSLSYEDRGKVISQKMKIKVRGHFRRNTCKFPPLKLNFSKEESKGSIFEGLDKVKMVVPCSMGSKKYSEFVHLEYLAYKGYNIISDTSFRVRLAEVTFIDEGGKYNTFTEWTFLIEPLDELGFRLRGLESEREGIHPNYTDRTLATKLAMYEYLIGNTDWSIATPHNIKLLQPIGNNIPLTIPYDFDFAGLICPPYASPDPKLGIKSVRDRLYRGFCQSEDLTLNVLDHFNARKGRIIDLFQSYPHLDAKAKKSSLKYIKDFYKVSENPRLARTIFIKRCRNS